MNARLPVILLAFGLAAARGEGLPKDAHQALVKWFSAACAKPEALPPDIPDLALPDKPAVEAVRAELWACYKEGATAAGWDKQLLEVPPTPEAMRDLPADKRPPIKPGVIEAGGRQMPYFLLAKGKKPANGWPLVIALHGGGGAGKKVEPHGWEVNTREWQTQVALFERIYPNDAVYFIPRMPDDNDGRWWYDYCQEAYDRMLRRALLFREVDPNRIYITGISEGGYAAFRLPAHWPDRFAAASAQAAAEPIDTSPPENLRNVALRCDIGENDTMFDRVNLARKYFARLDELGKGNMGSDWWPHTNIDAIGSRSIADLGPGDKSAPHILEVQPGRGHGIDYAAGPAWMMDHTRNPRCRAFAWTMQPLHHSLRPFCYWMGLDKVPEQTPVKFKVAFSSPNEIRLTAEGKPDAEGKRPPLTGIGLRILLDDALADLDQEIAVVANGREVYRGKPVRSLARMARTLADRGDPAYVFPAEIHVQL